MRDVKPAALVLIILGVLAWLIVGGILLIDSARPVPVEPTAPPTRIAIRPTDVPTVTPLPTMIPATTLPPPTPTDPPTQPPITATPSALSATTLPDTVAATAQSSGCAPPEGWVTYSVEEGDTLFGFQLGSQGALTVDAIMHANCLKTKLLSVGQSLYLPPGVADKAPKIDNGPAEGPSLPAGLSRTAQCPCSITVRAGWRLEQIAALVDKTPVGFTGRDFMVTVSASAPLPSFGFLSSKPPSVSLEGFLFPGSYNLDNTTTAVQFRDQLLSAFDANVNAQMRADAGAHGLNLYQVVVMASIVQRESYYPEQQKLIASVFYNRIAANKGIASTVTVQYALGQPGNWWPRVVGSQINLKSPYNTNIRLGLPPTPISSPDLGAILSTIYPAQTDYQYFAKACNAPGNFFTRTFEEFEQGLKCAK